MSSETSEDIVRIALTFGLLLTILIASLGPLLDCHVNPAVTVGLFVGGNITLARTLFYILAQLLGAICGTGTLYLVVPEDMRGNLGMTQLSNKLEPWQGLISEIFLTFFLLIVISACVDQSHRDHEIFKSSTPIIIGFTITALNLSEIPYTGTSLNPARSFGPALFKWNWENHWIYWVGPITGAILGALTYRHVLVPKRNQPMEPIVGRSVSTSHRSFASQPGHRLSVESSVSCQSAVTNVSNLSQASRRSVKSTASDYLAPSAFDTFL